MRESSSDDGRQAMFTALRLEPLHQTSTPVAPCMEKALGYRGFRRYVAFKRTPLGLVYWTDGIDDGLSVISIWDRFLQHPLIAPHVGGCHFEGRMVDPEELTMFASPAQALRVKLEELGDAILLDREKRIVWIGFFARAFLHLTLAVAYEALPDDDESTDDPEVVDPADQSELLEWLDVRINTHPPTSLPS